MIYKLIVQNGDDVNVMMYYENITSFFNDLRYSSTELSNDFEHIRQFHINNNSSLLMNDDDPLENEDNEFDSVSQQNGSSDLQSKSIMSESKVVRQDTMEFFGLVLGKCDAKKCNILLRHCRDRDKIDNKQENKRRKLFFISSKDKDNDDNDKQFMLNEIFLETKLDIIHTALLHQQTNVMLLNKNKFITEIIKRDNKNENKPSGKLKGDEFDEDLKMDELPHNNRMSGSTKNK